MALSRACMRVRMYARHPPTTPPPQPTPFPFPPPRSGPALSTLHARAGKAKVQDGQQSIASIMPSMEDSTPRRTRGASHIQCTAVLPPCCMHASRRARLASSVLHPPRILLLLPSPQVNIDGGGPIIKTVSARRTGLETKKPYKWGPLGGFY